jgi:hypothetical protein
VDVARYLRATLTECSHGRDVLALVPEVAAAVLAVLRDDDELPGLRALLTAIAEFADEAARAPRDAASDQAYPAGLWPADRRLLRAVSYRTEGRSDEELGWRAAGPGQDEVGGTGGVSA